MHSPVTLLSGVPCLEFEIFDHYRLNDYFIPNVSKHFVEFFHSSPKFILIQMKAGFKGCLYDDFNNKGTVQGEN